MRFLLKLVLYPLLALVLLAVGGMFFIDAAVEKGIETVGTQVAKVDVSLHGVNLSLLSGKGALRGLRVGNPKGFRAPQAVQVGEVYVALKPLSVFSDRVVVHSVVVQAPEIHYEKRDGKTNLDVIQANVESAVPAGADKPKEPGKKLQIDNLVIRNATLYYYSKPDAEPTVLKLREIELKDLGRGPEGITPAELTRKITGAVLKDALASVGRAVSEGVGKAAEKIKGLFGK